MKLSKYEEKSYNKILKKYNDLFKTIAIEGKHCFNKDSHTIFNKDTKKLTKIEKYEIKKYWANYFPNIDINYHTRAYTHAEKRREPKRPVGIIKVKPQIDPRKPVYKSENTQKIYFAVINRQRKAVHLGRNKQRDNKKQHCNFLALEIEPRKAVGDYRADKHF